MIHPWKSAFLDLQRQVDEMFQELIFRPWSISAGAAWQPLLDFHETATAYVIEVDLPGVPPEAVHLVVSERSLTLAGQRQLVEPVQSLCNRCERPRGLFHRAVDLPQPIDPDKGRAEYKLGTCRIVLPKKVAEAPGGTPTTTVIQVTVG